MTSGEEGQKTALFRTIADSLALQWLKGCTGDKPALVVAGAKRPVDSGGVTPLPTNFEIRIEDSVITL
ncbi:MAG: hypothetical protein F6K09_22345 [Merismopedia sp. SIO2A8]|nr:hypothetical protein [Merismopedia sp. SIO2A8]